MPICARMDRKMALARAGKFTRVHDAARNWHPRPIHATIANIVLLAGVSCLAPPRRCCRAPNF